MLRGLAETIDGLSIDHADLAEAYRLRDLLSARIAVAAGAFDADRLWDLDASISLAHWFARHVGLSRSDAQREAALARKLHRLPDVATSFVAGVLSGGQAAAIASGVPERHLDAFGESGLVPTLAALAPHDVTAVVAQWRVAADRSVEPDIAPAPEPASTVHLSGVLDGRGALDGDLAPFLHGKLRAALALADSNDLELPLPQRRADALEVVVDSSSTASTITRTTAAGPTSTWSCRRPTSPVRSSTDRGSTTCRSGCCCATRCSTG